MPLIFISPLLSTPAAHALALFFASSYVGSLYLSKHARLSFNPSTPVRPGEPREKQKDERWRDDPDVIRARLAAVTLATGVSCAGVFAVLWRYFGIQRETIPDALDATLVRLGFKPDGILYLDSLLPHLVTPLLFLGPLYAYYLGHCLPFQRFWSFRTNVTNKFLTWQGVRNYIWAPITEEITFRACVLAVYHLSGASSARMIFLGPLTFGLAHIHHAWDTYNRYGRTQEALKRAVIISLFQLAYTTLFGFHCSYLFLRTGSIYPAITAHVFCNIMGLPEIGYELRKFPAKRISIIAAYIIGIVAFTIALPKWTRSAGTLYWRDDGQPAY